MAKKSLFNESISTEKQTAVKQTAVKQTAVKQKNTSNKTTASKFYIEYFVKAITPSEEDFSGATIMEWFDSGREVDAIACPYDYSICKNGFEVIWQGKYENNDTLEIVEEAVDQIKYWANDFDAKFKTDSHIVLKDSKDKIIQKFNF
ncbi:MAG: hypothetical protein RL422_237 [Bacteroidota bacterium]|jgi:hypothetical protein